MVMVYNGCSPSYTDYPEEVLKWCVVVAYSSSSPYTPIYMCSLSGVWWLVMVTCVPFMLLIQKALKWYIVIACPSYAHHLDVHP